jgi:phage FluMu gp28-like protein
MPSQEEWARIRRASVQAFPAALGSIPEGGILLPYQGELTEAVSQYALVVTDKSRRVGATWGIGAAAVLISGAQKSAGGMDTLYLGYNLDMAREFIDVCAMWAKAFGQVCSEVGEYLFAEQGEKGADRGIQAFRITFASGFEIVALSSRPRSLRGRQGFVILDEFAFHDDAAELLKAAMALLIWGGKVLVISTHNGVDNPFNELLTEIRSGKRPGKVVRVTFDDALEQGLYQRICLVTGREWSPEAEAKWRADIRANYGADADEELDCIPSQGSGVYLTSAQIEAAMHPAPVFRLTCPPGFELQPDAVRFAYVSDWLTEHLDPVLDALPKTLRHSYGMDFARSGDLSVFLPLTEGQDLVRRAPFSLEMRNVPFRQQEQILFHIVDRLPRFHGGKHDARGNGQFLAEYAVQRYGARVEAVMLSQAWYLENTPRLKTRIEERTIILPADADVKADLRQIKMIRGIPMVPQDAVTKGADGGQRHGDTAVAAILANAAAEAEAMDYGYRAAPAPRQALDGAAGSGGFWRPNKSNDRRRKGGGWRGSIL